ncbi:MAG: LuxR C-terminal-related transcriptional regulator [Planctomycetota bacterium]
MFGRVSAPVVGIVDTDTQDRELLREQLDHDGWATVVVHDNAELFEYIAKGHPLDAVVVDDSDPASNGVPALKHIAALGLRISVIVTSKIATVDSAVAAMKLGAVDYLEKPIDPETVSKQLRVALVGATPAASANVRLRAIARARLARLTRRERETLDLVVVGKTGKQIARELGISHKTVEKYRAKAMKKMEVDSIAGLVHLVLAADLDDTRLN